MTSGRDGSKATPARCPAATSCTPREGSSPAAASSSSTLGDAPAVIGSGVGRRCELRIGPSLDRGAHLPLEPAVEPGGPDLLETILLDLAALARLEQLVDGDPLARGIVRIADLADLVEREHDLLERLVELVRGHPAELSPRARSVGVLAQARGDLGEAVRVLPQLVDQLLGLRLRAGALAGLLDDVPAELGSHRLAELADLEVGEDGAELLDEAGVGRVVPAQVATARARS